MIVSCLLEYHIILELSFVTFITNLLFLIFFSIKVIHNQIYLVYTKLI